MLMHMYTVFTPPLFHEYSFCPPLDQSLNEGLVLALFLGCLYVQIVSYVHLAYVSVCAWKMLVATSYILYILCLNIISFFTNF